MSFVATLDGANIQHESALVNTQNVETIYSNHTTLLTQHHPKQTECTIKTFSLKLKRSFYELTHQHFKR